NEKKMLFELPRVHAVYVSSLAFSADGRMLVSCSGDSSLRLWNIDGSWKEGSVQLRGTHMDKRIFPSVNVALSRTGDRLLALREDRTLQVWAVDLAAGKFTPLEPWGRHPMGIGAIGITPDGNRL